MGMIDALEVSFASRDDLCKAVTVLDSTSNRVDAERLTISVIALHGAASLAGMRDRLRDSGIDVVDVRSTTA